jgi:hypothetical protein
MTEDTRAERGASGQQVAHHAQLALRRALGFARASDAAGLRWCTAAGLDALTAVPETAATYLASLAHMHALATPRCRLTAITRVPHAGFWPGHQVIHGTLRGIACQYGTPQRRRPHHAGDPLLGRNLRS